MVQMKSHFPLAALALLTVILVGPTAAADDGATVYEQYCAVCHGDKGDGQTRVRRGLSPPPRDFTTGLARKELSRERMITSVTHGRPGTAMMPFSGRLSDEEVATVVDHIRATFMQGEAEAARPVKLVLGEELYVRHCAVCHGDQGSGAMWTRSSLNPPPRDFSATSGVELTRERMITSVTHGRPGTAMMSFHRRLSGPEIEAVVDYVRTSFLGKSAAAAPSHPPLTVDMTQPFPKGLRGDVAKGGHFYQDNCATCHGEQGEGNGPRSSFISPKPRNFTAAEARQRLNRPALYAAVRDGLRGTVMPAWGKVLGDQELADVAEYVFVTFVHPHSEGKKKLDQP